MTEAEAYSILTEVLKTAAVAANLPIAFADVVFEADSKPDLYLEVAFFPNDPGNAAVAKGRERFMGIYQVTLVSVEREGLAPRLEIARQVANFYVKGEKHYSGTGYVKIAKVPAIAPPLRDEQSLRTPISVEYEYFA